MNDMISRAPELKPSLCYIKNIRDMNSIFILKQFVETRLLKKTKVFETLFNDYYIH